jgi:REP element-mobilizing transposase RayT
MPRRLRIEEPGAYYHLGARGNDKQPIFDDELRAVFLYLLERTASRYGWLVHAWALMSNHFHLVIRLGDGGLSDGMCELNGAFARASNVRFGRIDHCFGRRFWSKQLESDAHMLESIRYAVWNPARAGICEHPRDSDWTSYRVAAGLDPPGRVLAHPELLAHFGRDVRGARAAFSRFVSKGHGRCQAP